MPDESVAQAGSRFARDMKRIREKRNVSRSDIHDATMISVELIRSFEERGLVDHPRFNRVYLRSFVRSLAQSIDIDASLAVHELERALEGGYTNRLAVEYLGEEPEDPVDAPEPEAATPPDTSASEPIQDSSLSRSPTRSSHRGTAGSATVAVAVVFGLIIVAGLVWVSWTQWGRSADSEPTPPPAADTTTEQTAASPDTTSNPTPSRPVLGDTIYITVIASEGRVDPIRIRRDTDLRRPYYIEQGEAAVFPAQDSVVMERELDLITVLVDGYTFPIDPEDADGPIRITRASAQAFLDTAMLARTSVPASPDTFAVLGP